jgi:uncharacterized membrane protein
MLNLTLLIGALSVACGVMGGVFFAFSTFVVRALGDVPARIGIRAMQSINVHAITPIFMTALFGTGVACAGVAVYASTAALDAGALPLIAGAATYFLGTIVVTIAFNVPLNDSLAVLDPEAGDATWVWARYRRQWLAWNHVRTWSGILASAWLAYALMLRESI